jgi:hypothetical protein
VTDFTIQKENTGSEFTVMSHGNRVYGLKVVEKMSGQRKGKGRRSNGVGRDAHGNPDGAITREERSAKVSTPIPISISFIRSFIIKDYTKERERRGFIDEREEGKVLAFTAPTPGRRRRSSRGRPSARDTA